MKHRYFIEVVNDKSYTEVDDLTFYEELETAKTLEKLFEITYEIDIETDVIYGIVYHRLIIYVLEG